VWRVLVLVIAGCGHLGFQSSDAAVGDGARDSSSDGMRDGTDGAAAACPAFAMFCDGFETGDTSRWSSTYVSPGATLGVQTTTVHHGTYAAHGMVPAGGTNGDAASPFELITEQSTGMLAVREWVFQVQPLNHYDGVIVLEATATVTPNVLVGGDPSALWDVTENPTAVISVDHTTTTPVSQGTWTCVELDYTFGSPSMIAFYIDDSPLVQVAAMDPAPHFGQIYVGAARASSLVGTDTIVDDVVIAAQHIGCQ
jgi:hypothetical protein